MFIFAVWIRDWIKKPSLAEACTLAAVVLGSLELALEGYLVWFLMSYN